MKWLATSLTDKEIEKLYTIHVSLTSTTKLNLVVIKVK